MASSLYGIGISGLNAAQAGLLTTSHNISNVNTPGYSRQTVNQASALPQFTGAGFFGQGVDVVNVQREYSDFLETQMRQIQSSASQLSRYSVQIGRIDDMLANEDSGLSPAIDDFFAGVHSVAANPGDVAARQDMLSASNALVARFKALDAELTSSRNDVNSQLEANVTEINSLAKRIADLNDRIISATATGNGAQQPNDLLDQRDTLIKDLNKLVGTTVVRQSDGSMNVFIGSGHALVVGAKASTMQVVDDLEYAEDKQLAINTGGTLVRLRPEDVPGGEIGGLLSYRSETLNPAQNALGRIAMAMVASFNEQHTLGQDLNGAMGADYYSVGTPQVYGNVNNSAGASATATIADYGALTTSDYRLSYDGTNYKVTRIPENTSQTFATLPQTVDGVTIDATGMAAGDSFQIQPTRMGASSLNVLINDVNAIAAASPIRTSAVLANAGTATVSAGEVTGLPLTGDHYSIVFTTGSPTTYTITNTDTSTTVATGNYTSGATISFDNISLAISGSVADGDTFNIGPNTNGEGDNRNALKLASVQTQKLLGGSRTTLQGAYGQLVSTIGNKTREVEVSSDAQATLLSEASAARDSVSGVNLDEEAANLLRYQQAYQAAGKVLAIAGSLFDSILDIMA